MKALLEGKKILVIGGTGSLGQSLIKAILNYRPQVIRIFSRDEDKQHELQQDLGSKPYLRYLIGDIRDKDRLRRAMDGIEMVFHLAALKHVPSCEYNPFEAVKTNIIGTQNVIDLAMELNVEKVIYTSSDKAISPANTMGATKLVAERLMSAADYYKGTSRTVFAAVRFGNVMGSRGSVIPLFKRQIVNGGPVTVTVPEMTRFMMSQGQAVQLTLEAAQRARGGEIFVLKMPVVRVIDLAQVFIEEFAPRCGYRPEEIETEIIGLRPGEKLFEELMTQEEAKYAMEFEHMFAIPPSYIGGPFNYAGARPATQKTYSSKDVEPLCKEGLRELLFREGLIEQRRK